MELCRYCNVSHCWIGQDIFSPLWKINIYLFSLYSLFILITIIIITTTDKEHALCSSLLHELILHSLTFTTEFQVWLNMFLWCSSFFTKFLCGYFCGLPSSYIKTSNVSYLETQDKPKTNPRRTCVPLKVTIRTSETKQSSINGTLHC